MQRRGFLRAIRLVGQALQEQQPGHARLGWQLHALPGGASPPAAAAARGGAPLLRAAPLLRRAFYSARGGADIPRDPLRQAELLQQLNRAGQPQAVVDAFESGAVALTEGAVGEYVKALVRLDRLDNSRVLAALQRGASGSYGGAGAAAAPTAAAAASVPWYAAAMGGGGGGAGGGAGGGGGSALPAGIAAALGAGGAGTAAAAAAADEAAVGTARNPLVITHAEPGLGSQVLRLVRSLALAFILVTAVGAFLDEKSLTKGMMSSQDLKPQMESNTK